MTLEGPPAQNASPASTPRAGHARRLTLGLILTFAGLAGTTALLPSGAAEEGAGIAAFAVAFLGTWAGGILIGNLLRSPSPGGSGRTVHRQRELGVSGTVVGTLAWIGLVVGWGSKFTLASGFPGSAFVTAAVGALVWAGGFLMGNAIPRFRGRFRERPGTRAAEQVGGPG